MKKAVVLLSGGLDSATTLYYAISKGYKCYCLLFDYGQRHRREIESAKRIAKKAGCAYRLLKISFPWKGSSLLNKKMTLPVTRASTLLSVLRRSVLSPSKDYPLPKTIPSTYVPARNIIFLSFALSYAEAICAGKIFIGANAIDYSGYPDCRPQFIEAFNKVIEKGTKLGVRDTGYGVRLKVEAPLILKSKKEIVKLARRLCVPLKLTWSCYKGKAKPCGVCDSCVLRTKGFKEAKLEDPLYG